MPTCHFAVRFLTAFAWGGLLVSPGVAQQRGDWYRIEDGVSRSHVEYHETTILKGKELVLADLKGPGKITYFYITPVSDLRCGSSGTTRRKPACRRRWPIFWCSGGKTIDYCSMPMEIQHRCYMCYLPMPFSKLRGSSW